MPDEIKDASECPHFSDYVKLEHVAQFNGLIWIPSPLEVDWFEKLKEQGYAGKRIVLYQSGFVYGTESLIRSADFALAYPTGDGLVDKIFDYVKKNC